MEVYLPRNGVQDCRAVQNRNDGPDQEPQEFAQENRAEVPQHLHLEDACSELEQLYRGWRRHHGGDHDGEELLFFEAVAELLVALAVDPLEQEEFSAGTADVVEDKAPDSRTQGSHEAIQDKSPMIVYDEVDQESIDWQGDGGRVDDGKGADAPHAEWLQQGQHSGVQSAQFMKKARGRDLHGVLSILPAGQLHQGPRGGRCVLPANRGRGAVREESP